MPKQGHKQQSHYDKQNSRSKKLCKNNKGEVGNTIPNASIEEQLNEFKRIKKEEYYKYKQSVFSDAGEKDKSVNNNHWPIIVDDSILNGIVEKNLRGQGRLIKVKPFPSSINDDLSHHIIRII